MNLASLRDFCLSLKGATEDTPFDDKVLVFKVMGKMFCLTDMDSFESVNVKCEPEKALELREKFVEVTPGYHMSKVHWNNVLVNEGVDDETIFSWILDSYTLIVKGLTKKQREALEN